MADEDKRIDVLFREHVEYFTQAHEERKLGRYENQKKYKDEASRLLRLIKDEPLIEKLELVADLMYAKKDAEERGSLRTSRFLESYIRLFWDKII